MFHSIVYFQTENYVVQFTIKLTYNYIKVAIIMRCVSTAGLFTIFTMLVFTNEHISLLKVLVHLDQCKSLKVCVRQGTPGRSEDMACYTKESLHWS